MAASSETVKQVVEVVRKRVDEATFRAIVEDLLKVDGNASFKETIRRLKGALR